MKQNKSFFPAFIVAIFTSLSFAVAADKASLSVMYFENLSPTAGVTNFLSKALSEMLIGDLAQVKDLTLVEREGLEKVLREMEMGASGLVDEKSAPKIGKLLGATHLVTGSYIPSDKTVMVNYKIVLVEGGKIEGAGSISGSKDNLISLKDSLSASVFASLKKIFPSIQGPSSFATGGKAAFADVEKFGEALEFADRGELAKAGGILKNLSSSAPNFGPAQKKIAELEKRIKEYDERRDKLLQAQGKGPITWDDFMKTTIGLSSGFKYTQLLSYCRRAQLSPPAAPQGSLMSSKEMADYYVSFALYMLKRWDAFAPEAEEFLKNYPQSMYYASIKTFMTQALGELKGRDNKIKKAAEAVKPHLEKWNTASKEEKNLLSFQIGTEYFGQSLHKEALGYFRQIDRAVLEEKYQIKGDQILYFIFMCYHGLLMKDDALRAQKAMDAFYPDSDYVTTLATMMNYFPE